MEITASEQCKTRHNQLTLVGIMHENGQAPETCERHVQFYKDSNCCEVGGFY